MKMLAIIDKAKELITKDKEERATAMYMCYVEEAERAERAAQSARERLEKFKEMSVDEFLDYHGE